MLLARTRTRQVHCTILVADCTYVGHPPPLPANAYSTVDSGLDVNGDVFFFPVRRSPRADATTHEHEDMPSPPMWSTLDGVARGATLVPAAACSARVRANEKLAARRVAPARVPPQA